MNIKREAVKDASEFARAHVFFGEGAGNRRKLIKTVVAAKSAQSEAYRQAFEAALAVQDMVEHVSKAQKERRRRDFWHAINKNTKSAMAGRYTGVNMTIVVIGGALYYAHNRGLDQKAYLKMKGKIQERKRRQNAEVYKIRIPRQRNPEVAPA